MAGVLWSRYPLVSADPRTRSWLSLLDNLGRSPATVDAYGRGLDQYLRFCKALGVDAADATLEHVSLFVRHLRGEAETLSGSTASVSNATLQQRLTALRSGHSRSAWRTAHERSFAVLPARFSTAAGRQERPIVKEGFERVSSTRRATFGPSNRTSRIEAMQTFRIVAADVSIGADRSPGAAPTAQAKDRPSRFVYRLAFLRPCTPRT